MRLLKFQIHIVLIHNHSDKSKFYHKLTKKERENPKIIDGSRKKRSANGSGTDIATINKLLKQFKMMSEMMKKMSKGNMKGMADQGIPPELFNQLK